ncbi:MAG: PAS domain-containing protein [Spartobacteria bacterium]|nr:PAS domain-containing protein [Spartobacteria bacterium]
MDSLMSEITKQTKGRTDADVLLGIKKAFELFDEQSTLLQGAFEGLKKDLAEANRQLNQKNRALSDKVEELHQMSGRLECILESIGDGVLVVDNDMCVERCNPAALELLERVRSDVEGHPYHEIMNGLGNPETLLAAIEKGKMLLEEERTCDVEDHHVAVLVSVAPIRSTDGVIIGAVEVLRDVTQLRLLQAKVQHQQRIAALGEMAASVAHEIRNPLGSIEGFARLLRNDLDRDGLENHSRLASKIISGVTNLNYVITNLLTYARPVSLQTETFDLMTLFSSIEDTLLPMAEQQKVELVFERTGRIRTVQGDIRQLRQVFVNLGRNAIEALEDVSIGKVEIRCSVRKRVALFEVQDNGSGIDAKDVGNVFDPFFTRKHSGTGLGLSLCHKIVTAHGGEISVESKKGQGTKFTVTIPQIGERT